MLDPGRYLAEAIYFIQYAFAQQLWELDRALLSIALIVGSINSWLTDNVGYFVQLLVNALSAPLGAMFILALTLLGLWYALNTVLATNRWVEPGRLISYGLIAFFFFASPGVVIEMMEDLRRALSAGVDQALIDGAAGDLVDLNLGGTDTGLPGALPDVNGDGIIASFDSVAAFMAVGNINELDSFEFPLDFALAFFPFGDPAAIDLSDEADQVLARALAGEGLERLFFSLVIIPTVIAEHSLQLVLTGVAVFLYIGAPIAMLLAFFVYSQGLLGAYLRQFINLLIETFISVIIVAVMMGLLAAAAQEGLALFIGANLIVLFVLVWRIRSALRLATAAFDLFGGAALTGGSGALDMARLGGRAAAAGVGLAGAVASGGATLALGGTMLAGAAALQADSRADGAYLGTDPVQAQLRARQLRAGAGYALGQSGPLRQAVEGAHELRTLTRHFRAGADQPQTPDSLDFLRAGASLAGFGSSPWLAMRLSPSLRAAYDEIGGRADNTLNRVFDDEGTQPPPAGAWVTPVTAAAAAGAAAPWADRLPVAPGIQLEAAGPERRRLIDTTLGQLAQPETPAGQRALVALTHFTGAENAAHLQAAVTEQGAGAVQAVARATADLVAAYRQQGQTDAAILSAFQTGAAGAEVQAALTGAGVAAPLDEAQLAAVADMVLLPRRRLDRPALAELIGAQAAAGADDDGALAAALATSASFGPETGHIRGVMAGAAALQLSATDMGQLAAQIDAGRRDLAAALLVDRGHRPATVRAFISDLAALPPVLVVPQTTQAPPPASQPPATSAGFPEGENDVN